MPVTRRHFTVAAIAYASVAPALAAGTLPPLRPHPDGPFKRLRHGTIKPEGFDGGVAVAAINRIREAHGRSPLAVDGTLNAIAGQQAERLKQLGVLSHSPGGQHLKERAERAGYHGLVAENLAEGYETFEDAINAWLDSGYHRTTMLHDRFRFFGAGVAVSAEHPPGEWGTWWVTEFGV